MTPTGTVIVPANNEERGIARLLQVLISPDIDVYVVCNGCSDATADVARRYLPPDHVLEGPIASKQIALRQGNEAARPDLPRVYVDADIVIDAQAVQRLIGRLDDVTALAAAPVRRLEFSGVHPFVRAYYEVWQRLPSVRDGLFGRGVIAVSERGYARVAALPPLLSDDLAISEAFRPSERVIVPDVEVTVFPPKTVADLVRRRIRVHMGVCETDEIIGRPSAQPTRLGDLARLVREEPRLAPSAVVFVGVTLVARARARATNREGTVTWQRDESSRR